MNERMSPLQPAPPPAGAGADAPTGSAPRRKARLVLVEQVRAAYEHAPRAIPFQFVVATILVAVLRDEGVAMAKLVPWWLLVMALTLFRLAHALRALRLRSFERTPERLASAFVAGAALTGAAWGLTTVVFAPHLSYVHQAFLALTLGGLAAGGLGPMATLPTAFLSFVVPMFLPLVVFMFLQGGLLDVATGVMLVMFVAVLLLGYRRTHRISTESLALHLDKDDLIEHLADANRRLETANQHIAALSRRARRTARPLSLIVADVDHFKEFNDRHGHLAGDVCLRRLSALLARVARRPGDLVARYGGEEFVVLLPETDAMGAREVAEHLREAVEAAQLEHGGSPVSPWVTVSIGVSTVIPDEGEDERSWMAEADQALYRAKSQGRNRVESAEPAVA